MLRNPLPEASTCDGNLERKDPIRRADGIYLVELLIGIVISGLLMASIYTSSMGMYRASTLSESQVLSSNMAQQVIDNARNTSYRHLLNILGTSNSVTQSIPLYQMPSSPSTALFPRPLLRNEDSGFGAQYQGQTLRYVFNGTVTETLTNVPNTGTAVDNGSLLVLVVVRWVDSSGPHTYQTSTLISENGIHND